MSRTKGVQFDSSDYPLRETANPIHNLAHVSRALSLGSVSLIRVFYWFSTVFISLVGIGMGLYELSYDSLKGVSYTSTPYWVYFRLVLGLLQLHMHLFRLLPMRLFPRFADSAIPKSDPPTTHTDSTHDAGKLSKGKKTGFSPSFFYKALSLCNICLTLTLFGSCLQIRRLLDRETLPIDVEFVYLYGESVSALIWGTVLLARLAGILTNSTKEWFYLAWSSDVKKGRIPYGLKRDKA